MNLNKQEMSNCNKIATIQNAKPESELMAAEIEYTATR